jgi:hypothetical protein
MSVLTHEAPGIFALWGIPLVLVGLYLIVGRFFVDALQRARTYCALTNERAIIVSGLLGQKVKSLPLRTVLRPAHPKWVLLAVFGGIYGKPLEGGLVGMMVGSPRG